MSAGYFGVRFGSNQQELFNRDVATDSLLVFIRQICKEKMKPNLQALEKNLGQEIKDTKMRLERVKSSRANANRPHHHEGQQEKVVEEGSKDSVSEVERLEREMDDRKARLEKVQAGVKLCEALDRDCTVIDLAQNGVPIDLNALRTKNAKDFIKARTVYDLVVMETDQETGERQAVSMLVQ